MDLHENISLKNYLTMRLGGPARVIATAATKDELVKLYSTAKSKQLPAVILGSGSNTLAHDDGYKGLIIRNQIKGIQEVDRDDVSVTYTFGGGEIWDDVVKMSVEKNLSGIEALSIIPGTVGAAPVQNIGAYGQELADTFVSCEAYDLKTETFVTLGFDDCHFSYRSSIFREEARGRYAIVSVTLRLYISPPVPPFYAAVQNYFDEHGITIYTLQAIREAVIAIRTDKLPDPAKWPNSGSFFKNAIIEDWQLRDLLATYPDIPHYDLGDRTYKVPTGWLIEKCGLKGQLLHGMRVHDKNALVLINESAKNFADLEAARDEIIGKVRDTFRIMIQQEPLEL